MESNSVGLQNDDISAILIKQDSSLNNNSIHIKRSKPHRTNRSITTVITVTFDSKTFRLLEKVLFVNANELHIMDLLYRYNLPIPQIYHLDDARGIILMEDLSTDHVQGYEFDEETENGRFIRSGYHHYLEAIAQFHSVFWENKDAINKVGLPWHIENFDAHLKGIEKEYEQYKATNWNEADNSEFSCLDAALLFLKEVYRAIIESRFIAGRHLTIIHGDLHPGNSFISKKDNSIKFIDFEAVRTGLCTDDLAMFLAYHVAPDKKDAQPLLDHYFKCLSAKVSNYRYDEFLNDYITSIIANIFFSIQLINQGIPAYNIRDASILAYKTFGLPS